MYAFASFRHGRNFSRCKTLFQSFFLRKFFWSDCRLESWKFFKLCITHYLFRCQRLTVWNTFPSGENTWNMLLTVRIAVSPAVNSSNLRMDTMQKGLQFRSPSFFLRSPNFSTYSNTNYFRPISILVLLSIIIFYNYNYM